MTETKRMAEGWWRVHVGSEHLDVKYLAGRDCWAVVRGVDILGCSWKKNAGVKLAVKIIENSSK